ncbi:phosphoribosylpyrophosphate synthetase [Mucilaginibacter ginkgonis]|nr:phosphoribosylpyrophosphate synthetase [Mucilaginibacter ginkgonis]
MTTLSEIINKLRAEGYTEDFNKGAQLSPTEYIIDKHYRFEGESDPEDEAVVYAISALDGKTKGILVNGYGPSSDPANDNIVKSLLDREGL